MSRSGSMFGRLPWIRTIAISLFFLGACLVSGAAEHRALSLNGIAQYVSIAPGETILIDNSGPRFTATPEGAWTTFVSSNAFSGDLITANDSAAVSVWTPRLPRAGTYKVFAWWGTRSGGADSSATFLIKHAGGLSTNIVDQSRDAGRWHLLGNFVFSANNEEFVALRSSGSGTVLADAVRFVTDESFNLTQSVTLEAWVRLPAFDRPWQAVITKGDAWGLGFHGETAIFRTSGADGVVHDLASTRNLVTNRWHHVAASFDGNTKSLYVDGVLAASADWHYALATNSSPVLLGANAASESGNYFQGSLENVRIWSVALSASDVRDLRLYNLRGSEPGLLGDWRFNETNLTALTTADNSLHHLDGLLLESNSPPTRILGLALAPPRPGSLALRFNGFNESASVAVPADGRFDLRDSGTIEAWMYLDALSDKPMALVSKGTGAWELALENGRLVFRTEGLTEPDPANSGARIAATALPGKTPIYPGSWNHVAAVWNGSTGQKSIYLNGVLDATQGNLQGQCASSSGPVLFAARPTGTGAERFFDGVLDEVRIWSKARSQTQLLETFGRDLNGAEPGLAGFWKFDEGTGSIVNDKSPYTGTSAAAGVLSAGMTDLNRIEGRSVGSALQLQFSVRLSGIDDYGLVEGADVFNVTNLTIEAWVKPAGAAFKTVLRKGSSGYGLAIDENGYLRFASTKPVPDWPRSTRPLEFERDAQGNTALDAANHPVFAWNHIAVVVNHGENRTTFYINGQPAGVDLSSLVVNNGDPLVLGRDGVSGGSLFEGLLDEVRLWNVPRSEVAVAMFATTPLLGTVFPGLIGYWTFNEGKGASLVDHSGLNHNGSLMNTDLGNWQEGTDWGMPSLPSGIGGLNPNPAAAGLWLGEVRLDEVNEVQTAAPGSDVVAATARPASIRILLHVDAHGQVRLLKDVIVMKQRNGTNGAPDSSGPLGAVELSTLATNLVLITRPELIPNYEGVMKRGGKLVGLRYGTVAYDFEGLTQPLLGGVGPGASCIGRINLSKNHPTNPYRHKYHPDHPSGFDITRQLTLVFDGNPTDPWQEGPGFGVDHLTGTYSETVVGLHKLPLRVEGTVRFDRINSVSVLDDGQ